MILTTLLLATNVLTAAFPQSNQASIGPLVRSFIPGTDGIFEPAVKQKNSNEIQNAPSVPTNSVEPVNHEIIPAAEQSVPSGKETTKSEPNNRKKITPKRRKPVKGTDTSTIPSSSKVPMPKKPTKSKKCNQIKVSS
jgi:hypothetical protein